ncbi:MATE family efflux transporter [Ferrimonas marina]|uniref:Multidrug export protein MepA n=1 Tax=Ferrimonas marina TaxID=299255 RepID=A0A1M5VS51_9GAMM|nr:MATE family efflux transporter [Ferrimonas marina]SHH78085.1 putative efflux protein, MATE family [Ferrimonas marina]
MGQTQLSQGSVDRQFWRYVLPTVAAMLVSGLYQVIDGIFIGRYVGAEGLAGINLAWPLIGALYGIGMMIGVGSGAVSSLARGEKRPAQARRALGNGFVLIVLLGLVGMTLLGLWGEQALLWQSASGEALIHAQDYLRVFFYAVPLALGGMALPFMVRNDEAPNRATAMIAVGAVLNVLLDALFVALLGWGLTGAAIATALSQAVVMAMGLAHFFSARAQTRLSLGDLTPDWGLSLRSCAIGLSSLLMYSYFSFIVALHNALFLHYADAVLVGAFAIVGYTATLYYLLAEGVASGTQPLISYHYGAGELTRMKQFVQRMLWVAVGSGVLAVLVVNLWVGPIIHLFGGDDRELFDATLLGMRLHLSMMFLDGLIFSAGVLFQSLGMARKATAITLANMLVQLPFLWLLPKLLSVSGIWLAVPVSNLVLSLGVIVLLRREWQRLTTKSQGAPG